MFDHDLTLYLNAVEHTQSSNAQIQMKAHHTNVPLSAAFLSVCSSANAVSQPAMNADFNVSLSGGSPPSTSKQSGHHNVTWPMLHA